MPLHRRICLLALLLPLAACNGSGETPLSRARPGDTLVRSDRERVVLERSFRPGQPNGLYGGIVKLSRIGQAERRLEVNGVCSMPGLQAEGWPAYDNLYGRRLQARGEKGGEQRWQVLFHFDGRIEAGQASADKAWLGRLRDNICRRGSFDDRRRS
ncbi:MAG: hypothetical protein VKJ44_02410 [Synechococcus sp.]|nr:hypothetical protein [Synechococcus sp.]